jgi:MATE family multidrug resistance protein
VKATVLLGLPLIGTQLAQMALNVTNTLVLGRISPAELAASVLGWQFFFVLWMFGSGFGFAVMPLVATAAGAADPRGVRRFVRMGLWATFAYALVMMLPLWHAQTIFLALSQDTHISSLAAEYLRALQWSLFPQLVIVVLRSFLGALGRPGVVLLALLVGVFLNAFLNMTLVFGGFGMPALGITGSGLSTLISTFGVAIFLIAYTAWHPVLRGHHIFVRFFKPDPQALLEVFRLGWPIGTTVVAEVALFTATSFMMGWLGPTALAAHGIALQLSGLSFMIPLGLAAAATIRVGHAHGRGDPQAVAQAAAAAIMLGMAASCCSAVVFLTTPRTLIGLYLNLENHAARMVLPYAITFLAVAGIFQLFDGIQAVSSGALRGLKDTRVPMIIALVSYWAVGVPVGYWLAFPRGWGGVGIWSGLAIGLAFAAVLMAGRFVAQARSLPTFAGR